MLQQLGEVAVLSRFHLPRVAFDILIADRDLAGPVHLHEDRKKTQASVPNYNCFSASPHDLWIDQCPWLLARQPEKDDPLPHPNLRGRNAAPVTSFCPPVGQRVLKIADEFLN